MALEHSTVVYDVCDFKVYPLLTDSVGASPTYGAAVDVPGINQVGMTWNITSAEVKGDCKVIARRARIDSLAVSIQSAKYAMEVLDAIVGGTVTDTGTTPNQVAKWALLGPVSLPYFRMACLVEDVDDGIAELQVIAYKCQVTGGGLFSVQSDQFGQPQLQFTAIPPYHPTTAMVEIYEYETAAGLPA